MNIEQYGLSLDGNVLTIANMPANVSGITVKLNVIALGLNGSAVDEDIDVTVNQDIQVAGGLEDKNVTLSTEKVSGAYTQNVLWDVADFQFTTATQKDAFFKAGKTMSVYLLDEMVTSLKQQHILIQQMITILLSIRVTAKQQLHHTVTSLSSALA